MQCCFFLQHWTLLPPPVTSTTGHCFCFGSISSLFLEFSLQWSPVSYWAPTNLGNSSFSVLFLPFHTLHGVLKARILKWFAIPFSSRPHSVRPLHHDPPILGGPTGMAWRTWRTIQLWHTPFPIWNQPIVPCPVLTVASWPVYRFLKRQVRWSGIPISFRIFHSFLWSTQSKALA